MLFSAAVAPTLLRRFCRIHVAQEIFEQNRAPIV
jgi:hypothetical protein